MSDPIEELRVTFVPFAGAGPDKAIVQAAWAPQAKEDGEQLRLVTVTTGCKATVAVDVAAPRVTVSVAV